jgi:aryl-alcohol dehydrogenase-like predicted oxidoreductase
MLQETDYTILGSTSLRVSRLGLAATYRPGKHSVRRAIDEGINYFFYFGIDTQMVKTLREMMRNNREWYVVATGAYNYIWWHQNIRKTLEKRLRQLKTDYIDIFLFLGVLKETEFSESLQEELCKLREEGKVRSIGLSTHNRKLAGKLAAEGTVDVLMIRYNAAHRGAEQDIFPYLLVKDRSAFDGKVHNPGVVSYTATRWRYLIRRPKNWPKDGRIPTAGMCYRFVLSNPNVHVVMTAPTNEKQLIENIAAIQQGPLNEEDMAFMQQFGDVVHHTKKWFM